MVINNNAGDPLGMRRFALTETAQDLFNRLDGVYGRLARTERQKAVADACKLDEWHQKSITLATRYWSLEWNTLACVEQLVADLTAEWEAINKSERIPNSPLVHAN